MLEKIIELFIERIIKPFKQFFKFCVVGTMGAIIDIGGLWLLVELGGWYYLLAAGFSFTAAVINNYFLNKYWTFNDLSSKNFKQFFSFVLVSVGGLVINLGVMYFFVEQIKFDYLLSKAIASLVVLSWNFLMNKYIIFKKI
ncbi:MAG TPA: GtrA family protein [bacterium]|nr:GtrA family protein [bacterium]